MVDRGELFRNEKKTLNTEDYFSRQAFLDDLDKGCEPGWATHLLRKGTSTAGGALGGLFVGEVPGMLFGGLLGYSYAAEALETEEQACKMRSLNNNLRDEAWSDPRPSVPQ